MQTKISYGFNGLQNVRYEITHRCNANPLLLLSSAESTNIDMNTTYAQLIEQHRHRISTPTDSDKLNDRRTQVFRNQLSTLNSYLAFVGKSEQNLVGSELLKCFDARCKEYLLNWKTNPKARSDRQSHLRAWNLTAKEIQQATSPVKELPFHQVLRQQLALQNLTPHVLGKKIGLGKSGLQRWLAGAFPNQKGIPALRRLETALGLRRGHFEELLPNQVQVEKAKAPPAIPYRERSQWQHYAFRRNDFSPSFLDEWREFLEYKTCISPEFKRNGVWRLLPQDEIKSAPDSLCMLDGEGCPTASLTLHRIRYFLGFLCLSANPPEKWAENIKQQRIQKGVVSPGEPVWRAGLGLASDEVQSLAMLANAKFVNAFLRFMKMGSNGIIHGGHNSFATFVAELTRPETGYLWQQPHFARAIAPEILKGKTWTEFCAEAHKTAKEWKKVSKNMSRNPDEPLRPLLDLKEPLLPLFRAINELDQLAAEAAPGSREQAEHKRNALLIAFLVSNPLRIRTISLIRWNANNTGNLYRHPDENWHVRLTGNNQKNKRGTSLTDYDAILGLPDLAPRLEEYLEIYRPVLIRKRPHSEWLFPNALTGGKHLSLNKTFAELTKRHIPEVISFGPHGVRHLVATDFLNKSPSNFRGVAHLLNDSIETVLKNYDREKLNRAFNEHGTNLAAVAKLAK